MRRWIAAGLLMCGMGAAGGAARAQDRQWKIDPNHSEADFAIRHMGISTVHGSFHAVSGNIWFDPKNPPAWKVDATIQASSVDTGVAARDKDLRGTDFFDAAQYPTMTFRSTSVQQQGDHFDVKGNLTLHGVTRPVVLNMEHPGAERTGMDGHSVHRGFLATTTINRRDFGLNWNGLMKGGDAMLGDQVRIELDVEMVYP